MFAIVGIFILQKTCHAQQGYKIGDVRGGISVALPYDNIETALQANQRRMIGLGMAIFIVLGCTFYFLVWKLMRRLDHTVSQLDDEKLKLEISQTEILAERNKLDDIISSIDADLLLLDKDLRIIWVNKKLKERETYSPKDLVGQLCNKAYCNTNKLLDDCPAKLAFESGRAIVREHPIHHPDGTTRLYSFTCSPVRDNLGQVSHVLELVQDITDKKKNEQLIDNHTKEISLVQQNILQVNKELLEKNSELERFNKLFVDREFKIKELKERLKKHEQGESK